LPYNWFPAAAHIIVTGLIVIKNPDLSKALPLFFNSALFIAKELELMPTTFSKFMIDFSSSIVSDFIVSDFIIFNNIVMPISLVLSYLKCYEVDVGHAPMSNTVDALKDVVFSLNQDLPGEFLSAAAIKLSFSLKDTYYYCCKEYYLADEVDYNNMIDSYHNTSNSITDHGESYK